MFPSFACMLRRSIHHFSLILHLNLMWCSVFGVRIIFVFLGPYETKCAAFTAVQFCSSSNACVRSVCDVFCVNGEIVRVCDVAGIWLRYIRRTGQSLWRTHRIPPPFSNERDPLHKPGGLNQSVFNVRVSTESMVGYLICRHEDVFGAYASHASRQESWSVRAI